MNHYPTITNVTKQAIIKSENSFAEFDGFLSNSDIEKLASDKPKWWKSNAWSFLVENNFLGKPLYGFDNGIVFTENAVVLIDSETSSFENPSTIVVRTLYWPYQLGDQAPTGAKAIYQSTTQEDSVQLQGMLYPFVSETSRGHFFSPQWLTDVVVKKADAKGRIRVDAESVLTTLCLNYVDESDNYIWRGNLTLPKEKYLKVFLDLHKAVREEQQSKQEELKRESQSKA